MVDVCYYRGRKINNLKGGSILPIYLLITATVMFLCVILNKISSKLGIPMLLAFILLGMVFGSDGIFKIPFDDFDLAEKICSIALIFIMFYGGFGTNWGEAKPVVIKATLLSSFGVVMTAGIVGAFCYFILRINWKESLLIGSVISSTDAASVFYILRSKRLNLKYNTASLLEVESGSNDPFSYMLTAIMISIMTETSGGGSIAYLIFSQLVYSIIIGAILAVLFSWLLERIHFKSSGFDAIFVTAVAIIAFAAPAAIGGNGYLSTYIVGIVLGNRRIHNKKTLVPFFDGINGLMQMVIFFLLGLLSFPSRIPEVTIIAIPIALFLTFIARPIVVFLILGPFKSKLSQMLVVSWAGLRGAASIVFAVMVMMGVKTENDIFHIVFCVVLFSILLQGSLLPMVSIRLGLIDANADVMKTFSDYTDELPVRFIQVFLSKDHPWCDCQVKDIILPPDTLLVLIQRGEESLVPKGFTQLNSGDRLILSAKSPEVTTGIELTEKIVDDNDSLIGKRIKEIKNYKTALIAVIVRNNEVVIPNGDTIIEAKDLLVIHHENSKGSLM